MKIEIAENSGTCFGVERAIKKSMDASKNNKSNLYIMGDIVHNPFVVKNLTDTGVKRVESIEEIPKGGSLIVRAHGEPNKTYEYCEKNNVEIIDCTCPFVKKAQNIAIELENQGHQVFIIGEPDHPEVKGILAQTKKGVVINSPNDVKRENSKFGKVGILSQTTQCRENFTKTVAKIVKYPKLVKIHNTICTATEERQRSAKKLAGKVELMIVIGGKNSSNTKRLYEICKIITKTRWIENAQGFDENWIKGVNHVGITAGASTPKEMIDELFKRLKDI